MKKIKAIKMATGGLMSMPPYIAKQDTSDDGISAYDVTTPTSARKGLPQRVLSKDRTRFKHGGKTDRLKYNTGKLSTKEIVIAKKMEQLTAMKESGLDLTEQQTMELENYNASKAIKTPIEEKALGGIVGDKGKYNQRPDYQAYAEGDLVEDETIEDEEIIEEPTDTSIEDSMNESIGEETSLLEPLGMEDEIAIDEDMEEEDDMEGVDAIIDTSALSEEEESVLDMAIEMHPELEAILPKLVATEFTEDGEVEGPGTGTSDSIPALLSDGEFVITAKAVKNIGVEKLRQMMEKAESEYDNGIQSQVEEQEIV